MTELNKSIKKGEERQKRNIAFDEELDYELNEDSLDMERLKTDFRELTGKEMSFNDLLNLKILKKEHDKIHPTFGGCSWLGKPVTWNTPG